MLPVPKLDFGSDMQPSSPETNLKSNQVADDDFGDFTDFQSAQIPENNNNFANSSKNKPLSLDLNTSTQKLVPVAVQEMKDLIFDSPGSSYGCEEVRDADSGE